MVNGALSRMGTTAVINNHVKLPDGWSLINTTGERRFRVLHSWEQDVYKIAKVEMMPDEEPPTSAADSEKVSVQFSLSTSSPATAPTMSKAAGAIERVEEALKLMKELQCLVDLKLKDIKKEVCIKYGEIPCDNPLRFSFWLSAMLPVVIAQKQQLLECQTALERLKLAKTMLVTLELNSAN